MKQMIVFSVVENSSLKEGKSRVRQERWKRKTISRVRRMISSRSSTSARLVVETERTFEAAAGRKARTESRACKLCMRVYSWGIT